MVELAKSLSEMESFSIVGGTYYERCDVPYWNELFGSGYRAAVALHRLVKEINFYTYADERTKEKLSLLSKPMGLKLTAKTIDSSITFHYVHPLYDPEFFPTRDHIFIKEPIEIKNVNNVLCFGMIEGN